MTRKTSTAALILLMACMCGGPALAQETTSYLINWVPNPEPTVAGYIIYRSTHPVTGFEVIDSVDASTTNFTDTGRLKGTYYYYRLRAKDGNGERGLFSNLVSGMTIPQGASSETHDLCKVVEVSEAGGNSLDVDWQTQAQTIGFIQYGQNYSNLDSVTDWDDDSYSESHSNSMTDLLAPATYYLRAVSYDTNNNMIISAVDTFAITSEPASPLSAPNINIYPVPYHPGGNDLSMENLPENGQVFIYNGNGLEVWKSEAIGSDKTLSWNGSNRNGSPVMSGVYYVVTRDAAGSVLNKRPIMVVN